MSNIQIISLVLLTSLGFSGCGSDSETKTSSDNSVDVSLLDVGEPIVSYTCEASGNTMSIKSGANGNFICTDINGYPELRFIDGKNEMIITQAVIDYEFNSNESNAKATVDLQSGTENIVVTESKYGSVDCVNKYDIELPLYIYDAKKFEYFNIQDYQLLSTTCPNWVNENDYNNLKKFKMLENAVVTEVSGDISKMSRLVIVE